MNKIFGIILVMVFILGAGSVWSQSKTTRTSTSTSSVNTLKSGPAKGTGYTCINNADDDKYCKCTGVEDCMNLKNSGKCTNEIEEQDGGKTGECDSNGADKPSAGGLKLKTSSDNVRHSASQAMAGMLKAGANGDTGYSCDYGKSSIPLLCSCDGINDCFKLKESGNCLGAKIKDNPDGVGGSCKP